MPKTTLAIVQVLHMGPPFIDDLTTFLVRVLAGCLSLAGSLVSIRLCLELYRDANATKLHRTLPVKCGFSYIDRLNAFA